MINNKIKLLFKKWLCKVVAFYIDKPYKLVLNEHQQFALQPLTETQTTKWLLVVGRQHYNEQLNTYPIGNKKELKKEELNKKVDLTKKAKIKTVKKISKSILSKVKSLTSKKENW